MCHSEACSATAPANHTGPRPLTSPRGATAVIRRHVTHRCQPLSHQWPTLLLCWWYLGCLYMPKLITLSPLTMCKFFVYPLYLTEAVFCVFNENDMVQNKMSWWSQIFLFRELKLEKINKTDISRQFAIKKQSHIERQEQGPLWATRMPRRRQEPWACKALGLTGHEVERGARKHLGGQGGPLTGEARVSTPELQWGPWPP